MRCVQEKSPDCNFVAAHARAIYCKLEMAIDTLSMTNSGGLVQTWDIPPSKKRENVVYEDD